MRVVSWNCNGALRKKWPLVEALHADICVFQECEDPSQALDQGYQQWAKNALWIGSNKNKGMLIVARPGFKLRRLDWDSDGLELFLPCEVNEDFLLLAVWTKQKSLSGLSYIQQFGQYFSNHREKFLSQDSLLLGDFNSNACWDKPRGKYWDHSRVVAALEKIQIRSLYHLAHGEEHGRESQATLYFKRDRQKPYHIDYVFGSSGFSTCLRDLRIGSSPMWLGSSDHMPIYCDFY